MKHQFYLVVLCMLLFLTISNANAELQGLDLDGNTLTAEAYYDTDLDISWLVDANYAQTSGYTTISDTGRMSWEEAMTWASTLDYYGVTGWRLPTTLQLDPTCTTTDWDRSISWGFGCAENELAHLFYSELGGSAGTSILASSDPDVANFINLQTTHYYWNSVQYSPDANYAWAFTFTSGAKDAKNKAGDSNQGNYAWAVHEGAVGTAIVPEPISSTLFIVGSATLGFRHWRKRKTA